MEVKRYKAGTLKGEITTSEIRKLIRAHNKASSIKIPPKSSRENIVGILKKAGYVVNHEKAELRPVPNGKVQKLKVISQKTIAEELPKPKPLTEEQKKQRQQAKQKKAGEKAFLKAVIPKPPSVSKPSKGIKVGKPPPKKEKKEKKKFPTEGAKKIGEAIKAKAKANAEAKAEAKKKAIDKPLFEEKIETPEETFLRNVLYVIRLYQMGPSERGYVDINQKKKDRTLEVLGSIIDKKKTSKFNKTEIKQLEGALRFYKFSQSTDKKGIENWETILANTGSKKKAEPKKVEPRMKGGLISMIMESEGEAKTILENILKKYNSLTEEQKEKNRLALDNKLFDRVISFQRVNSAGDIIGGGIKALKEVQKAIDEMGSK
jgi:hypothetical protein